VLIAGGGIAALEAALALRALAGERLEIELCAPRGDFTYRPFALGELRLPTTVRGDLAELAARIGVSFRPGGVVAVDVSERRATARGGERISYDYLLVASGARALSAMPGVSTFWGVVDEGGFSAVLRGLRAGVLRDVVFTAPAGSGWATPLYELALLASSVLARSGIEDARLTVVTPEAAPLALFGPDVVERARRSLEQRGIGLLTATRPIEFHDGRLRVAPGDAIETEAVVSLPRLEGRAIDGLAADEAGFIAVDAHCRAIGAERVFAAGDVTDFAVKLVGVAARQADAAAEAIAAAAGSGLEPAPFGPALRWPDPADGVAGLHLGPFLVATPVAEHRVLAAG
jgi:sulfide:quinone oxidoreductase